MGATPWQIILRFILPEARSSLILNLTTATIILLAQQLWLAQLVLVVLVTWQFLMAINVLIQVSLFLTVIVLLLLVQIVQMLGNWLAKCAIELLKSPLYEGFFILESLIYRTFY